MSFADTNSERPGMRGRDPAMRPGHNDLTLLMRVALRALGAAVEGEKLDRAVYDAAERMYGISWWRAENEAPKIARRIMEEDDE